MQRFLIKCVNCALLIVILIGVPAVTGAQFWNWQVSSVPVARTLMLWGLALAAAGNAAAALFGIRGRKEQKLCWEWAAVFGALLGAECAFVHGWLNFNWLKQFLLWLQKHF
jgi:ABC-type transport system involved in multi-copper enzyme maturation permease subunit